MKSIVYLLNRYSKGKKYFHLFFINYGHLNLAKIFMQCKSYRIVIFGMLKYAKNLPKPDIFASYVSRVADILSTFSSVVGPFCATDLKDNT